MGLDVYAYKKSAEDSNTYNFAPMTHFTACDIVKGQKAPSFCLTQPLRTVFHSIAGVKINEGVDLTDIQIDILIRYFKAVPSSYGYPRWLGIGVRQFLETCKAEGYTVAIV